MTEVVFVSPRFTGPRFDEHTLPVDVARDLAAYEDLVLALAKHLYLKANPDRQRTPRGFADNFRLDIQRIDAGSTRPILALVLAGTLSFQGGSPDYFEQARDLVAECIAAPEDALPVAFPKDLLSHFNRLGRSLREGEAMELMRPAQRGTAILTPGKRKSLVLAADKIYQKEVTITGLVTGIDWNKDTFKVRLTDGKQIEVPLDKDYQDNVRALGGKERHQAILTGVVAYDAWDIPKKMISVDSLEFIKNHAITSRLDELAQLQEGWFEDAGKALNTERLSALADRLADYPESIALPLVFPTQTGNLLLEWQAPGDPSLDIDLNSMQAWFHAFDAADQDIEENFDLSNATGWQSLFAFLERHIPETA